MAPSTPIALVWKIAGLGNTGLAAWSRHSVGVALVRWLAAKADLDWQKRPYGQIAHFEQEQVILLNPASLMNVSGPVVAKALRDNGLTAKQLIVVHDDLERGFGKVSMKLGGSASGHNGLRSIIKSLGTDAFPRVRIGIGRPTDPSMVADYVIDSFSSTEVDKLKSSVFAQAADQLLQHVDTMRPSSSASSDEG